MNYVQLIKYTEKLLNILMGESKLSENTQTFQKIQKVRVGKLNFKKYLEQLTQNIQK